MSATGKSRPEELPPPTKAVARLEVAVVMQRQPVEGNRWLKERWEALGVVADTGHDGSVERRTVREDGTGERYLWHGFDLRLYADDAASYYANLVAEQPSVFVLCRREDASEPVPFLVTVSYGEASSYMETDETVYSVPMSPEVHAWVERYVLQNYVPEKMAKRKRTDWRKAGGSRR